jgi:hypothetical protein
MRREEEREEMNEFDEAMRNIEHPPGGKGRPESSQEGEPPIRRIVVDKRTHRVRLENETESEVTVVIEEKGGKR